MNSRGMAIALRLVGIGWYVGICIGGGALGGWLLDGWLGLEVPAFTLIGLGLGIALAPSACSGCCGRFCSAAATRRARRMR